MTTPNSFSPCPFCGGSGADCCERMSRSLGLTGVAGASAEARALADERLAQIRELQDSANLRLEESRELGRQLARADERIAAYQQATDTMNVQLAAAHREIADRADAEDANTRMIGKLLDERDEARSERDEARAENLRLSDRENRMFVALLNHDAESASFAESAKALLDQLDGRDAVLYERIADLRNAEAERDEAREGVREADAIIREMEIETRCRCDVAWTERGLHETECLSAYHDDIAAWLAKYGKARGIENKSTS